MELFHYGTLLPLPFSAQVTSNGDPGPLDQFKEGTTISPRVGVNVVVNGTPSENGVVRARTMSRAKAPAGWGRDTSE